MARDILMKVEIDSKSVNAADVAENGKSAMADA